MLFLVLLVGCNATSGRGRVVERLESVLGPVLQAMSVQDPPRQKRPPSAVVLKRNIPDPDAKVTGLQAHAGECELVARVFKPHGLAGTAELEEGVRSGDACAALNLGAVLFRGMGAPSDYSRGYALMGAAQDAGVEVPEFLCTVFDLAGDMARTRRCVAEYRRRWLDEHRTTLDGSRFLFEQYCENAYSSAEMRSCAGDAYIARDVAYSRARAAAIEHLRGRVDLAPVWAAFDAYCDVETERRHASFLGGSGNIAGMCTIGLESGIHQLLDNVLSYLAKISAPEAAGGTTAADVLEAEKSARDPSVVAGIQSLRGGGARYLELVADSRRRFLRFEATVVAAASAVLEPGEVRRIREELWRLRIGALELCPSSG